MVTYEDLSKLKYLDMVLSEVLRVHSPAVLIDRLCTKDTQISDGEKLNIRIEKGDHIWIPIYCFHHNENYYKNPKGMNRL